MQEDGSTETKQAPAVPGMPELRTLGYADLPSVISIERRSFTAPWSLAMFVLEMSKPSSICLSAHDDSGEVRGYLICARYDRVWHLMNVAVCPDFRRRGVALAMIEEVFARTGPESRFTLEVRESNDAAIQMYERIGFRRAGRRSSYYQDNGEDALIMWHALPPEPASVG